ncbi:MAG: helix-turn-helix domain-containing protein [Clostridia bacterium]|nr:helix-turn-helix domain-containing protein [Clostridia bacterium]
MTNRSKDSIKKALSINLRRIMEQQKIKNKDLAKQIGLEPSSISNYLNGKSGSTPDMLSKIAKVLQVSIDELISPTSTLLQNNTLKEDPHTQEQYEVPLFSAVLASSEDVYRRDNFDGIYTSPHPVHGDYDCYAVKIYNNLLTSSGFVHGSRVIFAAGKKVKNRDFAAVLLKEERKVVIRRVTFKKEETILSTDETSVSYSNKDIDSKIKILGWVISADFFPNP